MTSPARRGPCAICDDSLDTLRLCTACRADPANAEWSEGEPRELLVPIERHAHPAVPLAEMTSARRTRRLSERTKQILQLAARASSRCAARPRGRRRYREPWVWTSRALSIEEIAWLVGCSRQQAHRVVTRAANLVLATAEAA